MARGLFRGYAAYFNNVDRSGDVIEPGAFKRSLREVGPERPVFLNHETHGDPIGVARLEEDRKGLRVVGQLDLDSADGARAYKLILPQDGFDGGLIQSMSIGYIAHDYSYDSNGVRHLLDVDLVEVSVVSTPANALARIESVKALELLAECKSMVDAMERRERWERMAAALGRAELALERVAG